MAEVISTVLEDIFDFFGVDIDPADFDHYLEENGLMIVPIEDPTNLRYGKDD